MTHNKSGNTLINRQDLKHLAILLAIALGIGVYLIVTTVVTTKDGCWYIQQAQKLSSEPQEVIKKHPFGYMLLILGTHKLIASISGGTSLFTWIYSAQSITLLCRLLSIIPLYFIGKLFVGNKRSFQAILILIILPYPANFANEILREWPHILFLASGFLFLILAVKHENYLLFAATGLVAGLGHTIRPECAQLLLYGFLWMLIRFFRPKIGLSRAKLCLAFSILIIGFAIPAAPYTIARGKFLPAKLLALINSSGQNESKEIQTQDIDNGTNSAPGVHKKIISATGELSGGISENLMYFFVPTLLVGIYFHFRKQPSTTAIEKLLIPSFAALNVTMLIALYCSWGYISRRHTLPLVVFSIFYIPIGLEVLAVWLANRFCKTKPISDRDNRRWFFILSITGIVICIPKLLSRPGSDKPGYRAASAWLKENTSEDALIASPDRRITFYAERNTLLYEPTHSDKAEYLIFIVKNENDIPDLAGEAQKQYSVWENEKDKKKIIVIYKTSS